MKEGIYSIYKPVGLTSFDVVSRVRKVSGVRRVGHGGTLDPLAEGVLVVAVGRNFTKELSTFIHGSKEYVASIRLGAASETFDAEGPIYTCAGAQEPSVEEIEEVLSGFIGVIKQQPPRYSAMKVDGRRAYALAREGKRFELATRTVKISSIQLVAYRWPTLEIHVTCGAGVYIRSLAHDIGWTLQTGGYLTRLIRTRVGSYGVADSITLDEL